MIGNEKRKKISSSRVRWGRLEDGTKGRVRVMQSKNQNQTMRKFHPEGRKGRRVVNGERENILYKNFCFFISIEIINRRYLLNNVFIW